MDQQISHWFSEIPLVSKCILLCVFFVSVSCNLKLVPLSFMLSSNAIFRDFEIWRLFLGLFYSGRFSFSFVSNLSILYQYSISLEKTYFSGRRADYVFMILFHSVSLLILALNPISPIPFLGISLSTSLVYVWSKVNKDVIVTFFFSIQIPGLYLPWVFLLFNLLTGASLLFDVYGIIAGHLYYFLAIAYPEQSGMHLLNTPQFLKEMFPEPDVNETNFGFGTSYQGKSSTKSYFKGKGNVLGSSI